MSHQIKKEIDLFLVQLLLEHKKNYDYKLQIPKDTTTKINSAAAISKDQPIIESVHSGFYGVDHHVIFSELDIISQYSNRIILSEKEILEEVKNSPSHFFSYPYFKKQITNIQLKDAPPKFFYDSNILSVNFLLIQTLTKFKLKELISLKVFLEANYCQNLFNEYLNNNFWKSVSLELNENNARKFLSVENLFLIDNEKVINIIKNIEKRLINQSSYEMFTNFIFKSESLSQKEQKEILEALAENSKLFFSKIQDCQVFYNYTLQQYSDKKEMVAQTISKINPLFNPQATPDSFTLRSDSVYFLSWDLSNFLSRYPSSLPLNHIKKNYQSIINTCCSEINKQCKKYPQLNIQTVSFFSSEDMGRNIIFKCHKDFTPGKEDKILVTIIQEAFAYYINIVNSAIKLLPQDSAHPVDYYERKQDLIMKLRYAGNLETDFSNISTLFPKAVSTIMEKINLQIMVENIKSKKIEVKEHVNIEGNNNNNNNNNNNKNKNKI